MISFRKKLRMASLSAQLVGKFRSIWKDTRKYQQWLMKTYNRCDKLADHYKIMKPKPIISMEEE